MKQCIKIFCLIGIILFFNTCKKYPEGGWISLTRKHLFGGHKAGDSKTWKLKLYEVNGVDSTDIIKAGVPSELFNVTFTLNNDRYWEFEAKTPIYNYYDGEVSKTRKNFKLALYVADLTDSLQCKNYNGQSVCCRNFLSPEIFSYSKLWDIKKLTSDELIMETNWNLKNSYKIILVT